MTSGRGRFGRSFSGNLISAFELLSKYVEMPKKEIESHDKP